MREATKISGGAKLWVSALSLCFVSHIAVAPRTIGGWGEASSPYTFQRAMADVVGSFRLQRMISELCGNKSNLEYGIFEEIGVSNSVVEMDDCKAPMTTFVIEPFMSHDQEH